MTDFSEVETPLGAKLREVAPPKLFLAEKAVCWGAVKASQVEANKVTTIAVVNFILSSVVWKVFLFFQLENCEIHWVRSFVQFS